jgi:hypothetical protein
VSDRFRSAPSVRAWRSTCSATAAAQRLARFDVAAVVDAGDEAGVGVLAGAGGEASASPGKISDSTAAEAAATTACSDG